MFSHLTVKHTLLSSGTTERKNKLRFGTYPSKNVVLLATSEMEKLIRALQNLAANMESTRGRKHLTEQQQSMFSCVYISPSQHSCHVMFYTGISFMIRGCFCHELIFPLLRHETGIESGGDGASAAETNTRWKISKHNFFWVLINDNLFWLSFSVLFTHTHIFFLFLHGTAHHTVWHSVFTFNQW